MKDFYDLWFLAQRFEFDRAMLRKAIEATFSHRQTNLPQAPDPFTDSFANDATKQAQWSAFLRRNELTGASTQFGEVLARIRKFIEPVLDSSSRRRQ